MIKRKLTRTIMKFGTGDIRILTGYSINTEKEIKGAVGFVNHAPEEIGKYQECNPHIKIKFNKLPVSMTFSDVRSIDALIACLVEARGFMKGVQHD